MARNRSNPRDMIRLLQQSGLLKSKYALPVLCLVLLGVVFLVFVLPKLSEPEKERKEKQQTEKLVVPEDGYLFCFWNVENLFDDQNDAHNRTDEKFDNDFANNPKLLDEKLGNLSKVLLSLNGGRGPDIIALAEVESERAADLLRQRLNHDLRARAPPYENLLFREQRGGRHIATAILTRLPVDGKRTQKLDASRRILEGRIVVNEHELVVIASHWTSRVTDDAEVGAGRGKYGDLIFGRFKAMFRANPDVDLLVCGDFNDDPSDASVTVHLRAVDNKLALTGEDGDPRLFNLAAGSHRAGAGTLLYEGKWNLFDQITVARGLLDEKGWMCVPASFTIVREPMAKKNGRPWRFPETIDGRHGYADHFPVTVRLKVQP